MKIVTFSHFSDVSWVGVPDKLKHASSGQLECRGRSRTKSFEDNSQSHQRRLKRKRAAGCELSLNCLHKRRLYMKLHKLCCFLTQGRELPHF